MRVRNAAPDGAGADGGKSFLESFSCLTGTSPGSSLPGPRPLAP
jgi:hypothetical protein